MDFQQSRTFQNLLDAMNSELLISSKFLIYSQKARTEGYIQISNVFDESARNDRAFAETWMRMLNNGEVPGTEANLIDSYNIANYMATVKYQEYSRIAQEEGFTSIASLFNGVANIQRNHESRFLRFSGEIQTDTLFCKESPTLWICLYCGNILSGDCAPRICPICGYPQGYYQVFANECY